MRASDRAIIAPHVHVEYSFATTCDLVLLYRIALHLAGCSQPNLDAPRAHEGSLFNATAMRIHPIFTRSRIGTGDEKPDALSPLGIPGSFGDPTKGAGRSFELFDIAKSIPIRGA